ncbi:hypothetical protein KUTeg_021684 [Tegillarca granosa]|uniref:Uncharacterized protein n=1 Tax=Tegillarca granosa TaxID=220873 RepID=A0ABQ9E9K8_TEGGR|nr:hypothetical protein KUTeg_021684 [Tegillarca granosa]
MNLESNKVESAEIKRKLLTEHVESKGIRTPKKQNAECAIKEDTEKVIDGKKEQDGYKNETRITNSKCVKEGGLNLSDVCSEIKPQENDIMSITDLRQEKSEETTQKAKFIPKTPEEKEMSETKTNYVSPNSFLHDSICSQMEGKDISFTDIHSVTRPPFHSTVLPTPERLVLQKGEKNFLSPDSFLKELNNTKENLDKSQKKTNEKINEDEVPSPNSVLNDSIPHEIMIKQLETVKTSLFETKVFRGSSTPKHTSTTATRNADESGSKLSSFPTTPVELPNSPNPDLSRRSTHTVQNPKVLNLSTGQRKRLFPPLNDNDNCETTDVHEEKDHGIDLTDKVEKSMKNETTNITKNKNENSSEVIDGDEQAQSKNKDENNQSINGSKGQDCIDGTKIRTGTRFVVFNDKKEAPPAEQKMQHLAKKRLQTENRIRENKRLKPNDNVNEAKTTVKQSVGASTTRQKQVTMFVGKPVLPKHPMPFASKNMYYDERWMEKQERGFVHWLNFVLTPAEDYLNSSTKVKVDASKLSLDNISTNVKLAPTKEALSFREYAAVRRLNQLRRSACKLFQSEPVVRVIQKLEAEIESRRLVIRKDKMIHADLGLKQNILDMLLSYNPLWLRIGLEKNNDVIGLSRFIVTRLLGNPDVAKLYAHPTVPHLYRDDAIARHTLKKFLLLVYFLDYAKTQRLIHHDPCLFCKDSEFKTTKSILIEFSRDYLSGEGDITRHLAYLGYVVSHSQTAMDEFDFAVSNLATDLRDGIRLT